MRRTTNAWRGVEGFGVTRAARSCARALVGLGLASAALSAGACQSPPSLTVEIDAPPEANVQVEVVGPGSFSETIRTTTTFDHVAPGRYQARLKETRKRLLRPFIDVVVAGTIDGIPATVGGEGEARIVVRYQEEPGSGRVWIPVPGEDKIVSLSGPELYENKPPSHVMSLPAGTTPDSVAFRRGDLFVSLARSGEIVGFEAKSLAKEGPSPAPFRTIRNVARPSGIAFDSAGDLFVAEEGRRAIGHFAELDAIPERAGTIPCEGVPHGLAFDEAGTLYVSTTEPAAILVFSGATLASSKPTPDATIKGARTGVVSPRGVAFDADGNLWVTNADAAAVRFDAHTIAAIEGDNDVPFAASLAPSAETSLGGFAFGGDGQAWLSSFRPDRHELASGVEMLSQSPTLSESRALGAIRAGGSATLAFDPPPLALPIRR